MVHTNLFLLHLLQLGGAGPRLGVPLTSSILTLFGVLAIFLRFESAALLQLAIPSN